MRGFQYTIFLAAALLVTAHPVAAQEECVDPATPLRTLAGTHTRWPQSFSGRRIIEAREYLDAYLRSGRSADYRKARFNLENLEDERPSDPHIKLALAILYATGPDLNFEGSDGYRHMALMNNTNADGRAVRDIIWVLEQDSTQWLMAVALTRIALASPPEESRTQQAYDAVRRALSADPTNGALHLAWRDLLVKEEKYAEAAAYLSDHPSPCTAYLHAQAELMMINGDTAAGSSRYLHALTNARGEDLDRYCDDIRVMASIGQLRSYQATSASARPAWLRSFWERTAAASGRTIETRVVEQTVRAAYADAHFRTGHFQTNLWYQPEARLAVISDTSHIVPWSAAGVYYVRHGPPHPMYHAYEGTNEYEAWVYRALDPPVVVIMKKPVVSATGWEPLSHPDCDKQDGAFLGRFEVEKARERLRTHKDVRLRDMYFALADIDPRYAQIIRGCMIIAAGGFYPPLSTLQHEYDVENFHVLPRLGHTESSLPHFNGRVRMSIAAYEFRGPGGAGTGAPRTAEVIALSWIPVIDLRDSTSAAARLRFSYTVTDTLTGSFRTDTTLALPSATTGVIRFPVVWRNPVIRDGSLRVTAVDPADSTRGATRSMPFHVRAEGSDVALSDVVVADVGVAGPLVRGTYRISPLPDHRVRPGDTIRLFFELYGATAGEELETRIHVRRTDPKTIAQQLGIGKRDERTLSFRGRAEIDSRGVAVRDVELAGEFVPGNYSIDVTVRLANGTTAKRSAVLRVE